MIKHKLDEIRKKWGIKPRPFMYILEKGEPVPCDDTMEWGKFMEDSDRILARATIERDGVATMISTVFLAVDHSFCMEGPPILWETMVFQNDKACNAFTQRYANAEQAIAGHNFVFSEVIRRLDMGEDLRKDT